MKGLFIQGLPCHVIQRPLLEVPDFSHAASILPGPQIIAVFVIIIAMTVTTANGGQGLFLKLH